MFNEGMSTDDFTKMNEYDYAESSTLISMNETGRFSNTSTNNRLCYFTHTEHTVIFISRFLGSLQAAAKKTQRTGTILISCATAIGGLILAGAVGFGVRKWYIRRLQYRVGAGAFEIGLDRLSNAVSNV